MNGKNNIIQTYENSFDGFYCFNGIKRKKM